MKQKYEIFADYHQFYIQDDDEKYGDLSLAWTPEAVDRLLAVGPHVVGIGTARNMPVPVTIEIPKRNLKFQVRSLTGPTIVPSKSDQDAWS